MAKERESMFTDNIVQWKGWSALTKQFDSLPKAISKRTEGDLFEQGWVFRGHKKGNYPLEPSVERVHTEWAEAEHRMLQEFQSKALLHMDSRRLPPIASEHKLSWLAIMQHYDAATRLLDFTYSPYVALYFALRNRDRNEAESKAKYAEVWGIDAAAVKERAMAISREADDKVREHKGPPKKKGGRVGIGPADQSFPFQSAQLEDENLKKLAQDALTPCGIRRAHYDRNGFVAVALPTAENARLASQQGVFLFNGALGCTFEESLKLMMKDVSGCWYKRFRVPAAQLSKIEERLFYFNIHELSLFADTEGLAGFVKQKRLQFQ